MNIMYRIENLDLLLLVVLEIGRLQKKIYIIFPLILSYILNQLMA